MDDVQLKPFKWIPGPEVGFRVTRRPDGGMNFVFSDVDSDTLEVWRKFALDHLLESDRLTRNLYDLRQLAELTEEAVEAAIEANSDPSSRNIRLAVVVGNDKVKHAIRRVADLTTPVAGVEMRVFVDLETAEAWLNRPINLLV